MSIIDEWLAYLTKRNRSPETVRVYSGTIRAFEDHVGDLLTCTVDDAEAWWDTQQHLSVKSRQRYLATVKSFYRWAMRFDHIATDPTRRLDPPTQGRRLPKPIGRSDMRKALDNAPDDLRRAIALGAYAGLRVAEAASLSWEDIDLETGRAIIRGKGDKERAVAIGPVLLDELLPNTGGNVVTAGGHVNSAAQMQRRVNRYLTSQGIDATFHKLRSRFATVALGAGVPLLSVSNALGHANPAQTATYALTADTDLDLIADAVSR